MGPGTIDQERAATLDLPRRDQIPDSPRDDPSADGEIRDRGGDEVQGGAEGAAEGSESVIGCIPARCYAIKVEQEVPVMLTAGRGCDEVRAKLVWSFD